MNLKSLLNYAQAQSLGTSGSTLFRHKMPAGVKAGVLFLEPLTGTMINHYLPGYLTGVFSTVIRGTRLSSTEALAQRVFDAFTLTDVLVANDMLVKLCLPVHEPVAFPRTEGDYLEISITFDITYINPS